MKDFTSRHSATQQAEMEQHQLQFEMEQLQHCNHLMMQDGVHYNWDLAAGIHPMPEFDDYYGAGGVGHDQPLSSPELLNLFNFPRCSASSLLPIHNSPISFTYADAVSAPPSTTPSFRDLFQSSTSSVFGGMVEDDGAVDFGSQFEEGGLEFSGGIASPTLGGKGRKKKGNNKGTTKKHFPTEKQRREHIKNKYAALRHLVPNPTKDDRASTVGDAIEYIEELLRSVSELKLLVDKKRRGRVGSNKRHKTTDEEDSLITSLPLRTSWLQRKSKVTEVDVRIIEDEVTIKLVQRKKINCLLSVSKILDDLRLDLHHVAGGHIGDHYSFLFNTKMCEGSCVYASAIANKLIEVVDTQYAAAAVLPTYQ